MGWLYNIPVLGETRISTAHNLKYEKYQHFISDIQTYKVSVHPFEVGSHTGYISQENKDRLKKLHRFCKKDIKIKQLKNNISSIAVLSSYFIFNNRNMESWHTPSDYIMSPFMNMWNMWNYLFIQSRNHNIPTERSVNKHITLSMRFSYYFVEFLS